MALSSAATDAALKRHAPSRATASHLGRSFELVNNKLGSNDISDQTLAAVVSLSLYSSIGSDETIMKLHMDGLYRMIELRGGLGALHSNVSLLQKICRFVNLPLDSYISDAESPGRILSLRCTAEKRPGSSGIWNLGRYSPVRYPRPGGNGSSHCQELIALSKISSWTWWVSSWLSKMRQLSQPSTRTSTMTQRYRCFIDCSTFARSQDRQRASRTSYYGWACFRSWRAFRW